MTELLVSVVMAVHDNERYVAAAVESILHQTWKNLELIVIDDASSDRSAEILQHYAAADSRVRLLVNKQNLGLTLSLNRGLDEVRGDLVARMDGDDIALPERLEAQVTAFTRNPRLVLCGTATVTIDDTGYRCAVGEWPTDPLVLRWYSVFRPAVAHPTAMFQASLVRAGMRYDERLKTAQDYDLWSRLLQHGQGTVLEKPLLLYRQHAGSISTTQRGLQAATSASICQTNLLREFPVFFSEAGKQQADAVARFLHERDSPPLDDVSITLSTLLMLEAEYLRDLSPKSRAIDRAVQRLTTRWMLQALLANSQISASERLRNIAYLFWRFGLLIEEGYLFALRRLRARCQ